MRTRHYLSLFGGLAAACWSLPGDTLFALDEFDSSRVQIVADRQQGRTLFRHRLTVVRATEAWSLRVLDTALFRYAGTPSVLSGETFLQTGWLQRADSGWSASWRLWNRADGLDAPVASLGENAWRQSGWLRGSMGDSDWASSLAVGGLVERTDPGSASQGIRMDEPPQRGVRGAGAWAWEGTWAGLSETPARIAAHWSDLFGASDLRQAHIGLEGTVQASLTGNDRDTIRLEVSADSARVRSDYFLFDRADAQRGARASWFLPAGKQKWNAAGGVWKGVSRDFSGRNSSLTKNGIDLSVGVEGPLAWGLKHSQVFGRIEEDRIWKSALSGDLLVDEMSAAQDRRDRDRITELTLSDTLAWRTDRWKGLGIAFGLSQNLRSIRHPSNTSPVPADRPDEDIARKQFSVLFKSDAVLWGDRPTLSWSTMTQEDVYLRAVHSFNSWSRDENRLALNKAVPLAEFARPSLAGWAREQRDSWRYQLGKLKGRLEYGATLGGEIGPVDAPWASLQWTRWQVKSGAVAGGSFAPDQIQDVWNPYVRGHVRFAEGWRCEPWSNLYLERVESWSGKGWNMGMRSRALRSGADLVSEGAQGGFALSAGHVWSDPGEDSWIGSLSARYAW
ncbi:MAG: hypothetical protein AAB214_06775 [Fibrobacterota bacterium]